MATQRRASHRFRAPEGSDSEHEPRTDATSGKEHFESAEEESPPATPVQTPRYQHISGSGPAYPFSRNITLRQSPAITRTPSVSPSQQPPLTCVFEPIDLGSVQ